MAKIWDRFLTERDRQVFRAAGYAQPMGFGKRPALLIIDVSYGFCGDKPEPILDSVKRWPNSCGQDAWDALPRIKDLIDACHAKRLPVVYTTGGYRADGWDLGSWRYKMARVGETTAVRRRNLDADEIMPQIAPGPQDIVIEKLKPSAFHGTPLKSLLQLLGVDSLFVTGTTTSGCVRASVIDAFSENYRLAIAEEGCFDRSQSSHAINLMDMNAKYADVRPTAEIVAHVATLPDGLFELPPGPR
jgi:nicotinamidase-related amidase